jgi:hypothetical protein
VATFWPTNLFAEDGPSDCTLLFVYHTLSPKVLYLLIISLSIGTNITHGTLSQVSASTTKESACIDKVSDVWQLWHTSKLVFP